MPCLISANGADRPLRPLRLLHLPQDLPAPALGPYPDLARPTGASAASAATAARCHRRHRCQHSSRKARAGDRDEQRQREEAFFSMAKCRREPDHRTSAGQLCMLPTLVWREPSAHSSSPVLHLREGLRPLPPFSDEAGSSFEHRPSPTHPSSRVTLLTDHVRRRGNDFEADWRKLRNDAPHWRCRFARPSRRPAGPAN